MLLSTNDYKKLEKIQRKIILNTATPDEMKEFLGLIVKSGNEAEMLSYMASIGFDSIDGIKAHLNTKQNNDNFTTGLVVAGGAILLALLLSR